MKDSEAKKKANSLIYRAANDIANAAHSAMCDADIDSKLRALGLDPEDFEEEIRESLRDRLHANLPI